MTWTPVPWFIGGGAEHTADIARLLAFVAAGGAEGVVGATDLKVTQTGTPSGSVAVAAGAALLLNRSSGGSQQSYAAQNPTEDTVAVAPTTSSGGRSDLVVVRIEDPEFSPWSAPPDMTDAQFVFTRVIQNVPAGTTSAEALNLGYSAIALARIDLPVSTTAITNAMITDLRTLARPRSEKRMLAAFPGANNDITVTSSAAPQSWPSVASHSVLVPKWATKAVLRLDVAGALGITGPTNGGVGVRIGTLAVPNSAFNLAQNDRTVLVSGGEVSIPESMRGTTQTVKATAYRNTNEAGTLRADAGVSTFIEVEFIEAPA